MTHAAASRATGLAMLLLGMLLTSAAAFGELRFHTIEGAGGIPLNVVEAGPQHAPAVLLLHGFSQSYLSWLPQLRDAGLTASHRLVAMDLRGHAGSGKPWQREAYAGSAPWAADVHAVVTALELDRPILAGWSFGGYVAMDYIREYGADALTGVMLVGSHGGLLARADAAGPDPVGDLEALIADGRTFASRMSAAPLPQENVEHMVMAYAMMPAYVRAAIRGKRLDNQDLVTEQRLTLPVHVILGSADLSVSAELLTQRLSSHPCADVVVFQDVGHSPFAERPQRFNSELAGFAERATAGCQHRSAAVGH